MHDYKAVGTRLGGISRSMVFKLWYDGELGSVKVGKLRFSTDRQIDEYIARLEAQAVTPQGAA